MATERIDTAEQFEDSPSGWYRRWMVEIEAAQAEIKDWQERGDKVIARFLDERDNFDDPNTTKLNLFSSNVQTQRAMLYGKVPSADVSRKFGDPQDDVARVAGEILERVLNCDIERDGDGYKEAVGYALDDRLLPGLGNARVRYTVETGQREVPAKTEEREVLTTMGPVVQVVEVAPGYVEEFKSYEDVETDYVHWKDFLWSPARVWSEVRWVAFRVFMTREDLVSRFGEEIGGGVALDSRGPGKDQRKSSTETLDPWGRAEVWEIWNKDSREVFWLAPSFAQTLDRQADPLGLSAFFPCPRPMFANVTTSKLVPTPDYVMAQDQYDEVDQVSTRISALQRAIAVRGVYDKNAGGIKRLLGETGANELVPVDNWALFAEKGGIKGQVDWFPLEMVVGALQQLEAYRNGLVAQIYQVTGMSDIMRGQAQVAGTATEQAIKARFASVRVQAIQDEVSRFASDLLKLRAEIIARQFDEETILKRANMVGGKDAQLIPPAMHLIRDDIQGYRIEVKPENINLADAAAMKNERMEFMAAIGGFVANTMPMRQMDPKASAMLNEIMGWALASFKGSSQIEGAFDRFTAESAQAAMQPRPPPPPPPQLMVAKVKAEGEQQKIQANLRADLMRTQAETQAEIVKQTTQARADMAVDRNKEDAAVRAEERKAGLDALRSLTGV
jgi:hypothetical protein